MIVATSKSDFCIAALVNILEKQNPGVEFCVGELNEESFIDMTGQEEYAKFNENFVENITTFCDGFTIGWEACRN